MNGEPTQELKDVEHAYHADEWLMKEKNVGRETEAMMTVNEKNGLGTRMSCGIIIVRSN